MFDDVTQSAKVKVDRVVLVHDARHGCAEATTVEECADALMNRDRLTWATS